MSEDRQSFVTVRMLVQLLGGIMHLGGSCLRTDLIELQWRIAGSIVPPKDRAKHSDRFRGLLEEAEELGLVKGVNVAEGIGAKLELTAEGRGVVGYSAMEGPDATARMLLQGGFAEMTRIGVEGVSAVPVDDRKPK